MNEEKTGLGRTIAMMDDLAKTDNLSSDHIYKFKKNWEMDLCTKNLRDAFYWGTSKVKQGGRPKTSKAAKEQKRQRKARKLQRKLKKQRG